MGLFTLHNAVPHVHVTIKNYKLNLKVDFLLQIFLVITVVAQVVT